MKSDKTIVRATCETRPHFHDVDAMKVVWHGNYPKFLELGRVAVLDHIDYGYDAMEASGYLWPIVDMQIRYLQPIRLLQPILIETAIIEWQNRLKLAFEIRDKESGKRLTRAHTVQVAVELASAQMQWESPPILYEKLKRFL